MSAPRFVDVRLAPCEVAPDGLELRFKLAGEPRWVERVEYSPEVGPDVDCEVFAVDVDGTRSAARAVEVEDSGAGVSLLVIGGSAGLLLLHPSTTTRFREPFLLVAP